MNPTCSQEVFFDLNKDHVWVNFKSHLEDNPEFKSNMNLHTKHASVHIDLRDQQNSPDYTRIHLLRFYRNL